MGQAKRRKEALRNEMFAQGQGWEFPPSSWEADICSELKQLPVLNVRRANAEQLAWSRMPANECHANARWYEQNDPSGKARAVTGWWVQWPNYVLHSVIERESQLICITPSPLREVEFPFIADPKITWIEDGDVYTAIRNGGRIGVGVREFPRFTMAQIAVVRAAPRRKGPI